MEALAGLLPPWLYEWLQVYAMPFLKVEAPKLIGFIGRGILDVLLFIGVPLSLSLGSQAIWNTRYHLTPQQQQQVERWAGIASMIAYIEDVPPVVPLVLWYKEGGLQARNPNNCEGIMGLYTAIQTGELPCFPPGEIGTWEVAYQLQLGARIFKSYCPEIRYTTTDPALIRRCYLYYNAGPQSRANPDTAGYVMNGYDIHHQNMPHTDIEGRTYSLQVLGAWPVHLAIQTQLAQRSDPPVPPVLLSPLLLLQEGLDRIWVSRTNVNVEGMTTTEIAESCVLPATTPCLSPPRASGDTDLRPNVAPLLLAPISGSVSCGPLPGITLTPPEASLVLAPAAGTLTRYTDEWGHLALQIENAEWSIWLTGLRSYTAPEGEVVAGQPVGAVGGSGSAMPALHYAIYDKIMNEFVESWRFLPVTMCPLTE